MKKNQYSTAYLFHRFWVEVYTLFFSKQHLFSEYLMTCLCFSHLSSTSAFSLRYWKQFGHVAIVSRQANIQFPSQRYWDINFPPPAYGSVKLPILYGCCNADSLNWLHLIWQKRPLNVHSRLPRFWNRQTALAEPMWFTLILQIFPLRGSSNWWWLLSGRKYSTARLAFHQHPVF